METHVVGRGHEERLEQLPVSNLVDLRRHVQRSPGDRHRSAEPQEPVRTSQLIRGRYLDISLYSTFKKDTWPHSLPD